MKRVANALIVVALVCVCLFAVHGFYLVRADIKTHPVAPPTAPTSVSPLTTDAPKPGEAMLTTRSAPKSGRRTVALRPAETFNLANRNYRKIEVRSTFPIRIVSGKCHSDYTVDFLCEGIPSEIFISDARAPSASDSQPSNTVDVVGSEF
jgi:hypothetical protein